MSIADIICVSCGIAIGLLITWIKALKTELNKYKPLVRHIPAKPGSNYIVVETVTRSITMYSADKILSGDIRTALDVAVINQNIGPVFRMANTIPAAAIVGVYTLHEHENYKIVASDPEYRNRDVVLEDMLNKDEKAIISFANKYGITINANKASAKEHLN